VVLSLEDNELPPPCELLLPPPTDSDAPLLVEEEVPPPKELESLCPLPVVAEAPSLWEALTEPCTTPGTPPLRLPPNESEVLWVADWLELSLAPCDQLLEAPADWPLDVPCDQLALSPCDQLLEEPWLSECPAALLCDSVRL